MNINVVSRAAGKKGYSVLYFFFRAAGQQCLLPTKIKILAGAWSIGKKRITNKMPDSDELNVELDTRKTILKQVMIDLEKKGQLSINNIRKEYSSRTGGDIKKQDGAYLFVDYIDKYVERRKKIRKWSYLRSFNQVKGWLNDFNSNLKFTDLTLDFFNEFVDHLIDAEIENNTIATYLDRVKCVIKEAAMDRSVKDSIPTDFLLVKDTYKDPKPFWLDWDTDIKVLEAHKPSQEDEPYLQEFLFRCYTGLRHSDVFNLKEHHVIKNKDSYFIDFTVLKTGLDQNIQINSKAVNILKKWDFKPPKLYQQHCNRIIKNIVRSAKIAGTVEKVRFRGSERIVELLPKWKMVTTHTARRTFARHWMDKGGDIRHLSRYLGHSSIDITMKYVGWETKEVNEQMKKIFG